MNLEWLALQRLRLAIFSVSSEFFVSRVSVSLYSTESLDLGRFKPPLIEVDHKHASGIDPIPIILDHVVLQIPLDPTKDL